jgi:hypothetical protein
VNLEYYQDYSGIVESPNLALGKRAAGGLWVGLITQDATFAASQQVRIHRLVGGVLTEEANFLCNYWQVVDLLQVPNFVADDGNGYTYVLGKFAGNSSKLDVGGVTPLEPFILTRSPGGVWSKIVLPAGPATGGHQYKDAYQFTSRALFGNTLYVGGTRVRMYDQPGVGMYTRTVGFIATCVNGAFTIVKEFAGGTHDELGNAAPDARNSFCTLWHASEPNVPVLFVADSKLYYVWGSVPSEGASAIGFDNAGIAGIYSATYANGIYWWPNSYNDAGALLGACTIPALTLPYVVQFLGTFDGTTWDDRVQQLAAPGESVGFFHGGVKTVDGMYVFMLDEYDPTAVARVFGVYRASGIPGQLQRVGSAMATGSSMIGIGMAGLPTLTVI